GSLRNKYRRRGRERDAELIDRILSGKPLAQPGSRDTSCNRAGYVIGLVLPDIGPDAALAMAAASVARIPADGAEDGEHWRAKFERGYEDGARRAREQSEEYRQLWAAIAAAAARNGGAK